MAVAGITNATQIAAGGTCALLPGGQIDCWGDNSVGELGDGTFTGPQACKYAACSTAPVAVSGITNAIEIAAGGDYACALLSSGQIDCWGVNSSGELGDGTDAGPQACNNAPCSTTPVAVSGITNATELALGEEHACALLLGGQIDCWGDNFSGDLGDGTDAGPQACGGDACSTTPVAVSGITNATEIVAGDAHTCALLSSGQVDCWGTNVSEQLGDGQFGSGPQFGPQICGFFPDAWGCSRTPVAVSGITNATEIVAGDAHTCALLLGGQIDCWGDNVEGELGNGATTETSTPVPVAGIP